MLRAVWPVKALQLRQLRLLMELDGVKATIVTLWQRVWLPCALVLEG